MGKESAAYRARSFMKRPRINRMQITANDSQSPEFSGTLCLLRKCCCDLICNLRETGNTLQHLASDLRKLFPDGNKDYWTTTTSHATVLREYQRSYGGRIYMCYMYFEITLEARMSTDQDFDEKNVHV